MDWVPVAAGFYAAGILTIVVLIVFLWRAFVTGKL